MVMPGAAVMMAAVGAGGAIGAILRWAISWVLNPKLAVVPLGTLVCNLLGGFLIGLILAWLTANHSVSPLVKLFLVTGFLGGLTTFSTFSAENIALITTGDFPKALLHIALHLFGSLAMTAAGAAVFKAAFS